MQIRCIIDLLSIGFRTISETVFPAGNYMFKVNNRNTRTRCEICSKLTIKILDYAIVRCSSETLREKDPATDVSGKLSYAAPFRNISFPANIYLFKVNNRNTRKRCEIVPI